MSKERELLRRWYNGDLLPEEYMKLMKETKQLLAQPKQTEQEPKGYVIYKPEGSKEEEIIPLYTSPQKLLAQPDINTQYLLDQVARLTAENAMLKEKWLSQPEPLTPRQGLEEYKKGYARAELDLKREPLSDETIAKLWGESYSGTTQMVRNFARAIEQQHGIGVDNEC
jgi:hypothetical protein